MNYKVITEILIGIAAAITVGYCIYDLFPAMNKDKGDTISEVIRGWDNYIGNLLAWGSLALWMHLFLKSILQSIFLDK